MGFLHVLQRVWKTGHSEFFPSALYRDEHDPGTWRESWAFKLISGEVVAIYNDVTKRKEAEEEMMRSFERFKTVLTALTRSCM